MRKNIIGKVVSFGLASLMLMSQALFAENCDANSKDLHSSQKYRKFIKNTTWVVPPSTLLAYRYVSGNTVAVSDQTVWVIDEYDHGYFFGKAYVSLDQVPTAEMNIVGSVTPFGDVYISFFPTSGNGNVVTGLGIFKKIDGAYIFVMQMDSAPNSIYGVSHWSYMVSVTPNDIFYQNLPGEDMSVPSFISQF